MSYFHNQCHQLCWLIIAALMITMQVQKNLINSYGCKWKDPEQLTWVWTAGILLKGWLAEAAVVGLTKGPLFRLAASYALGWVQQTSMIWKHDFTLQTQQKKRYITRSYIYNYINKAENHRKRGLTGCCVESRAGVALSQMGGWELQQGRFSRLHQSATSSSAGPQTPGGLLFLLASHYLPDSSSSSPEGKKMKYKFRCY